MRATSIVRRMDDIGRGLDKLLNDVESLRKKIYETAPYDVIYELENIMETIRTLYPPNE